MRTLSVEQEGEPWLALILCMCAPLLDCQSVHRRQAAVHVQDAGEGTQDKNHSFVPFVPLTPPPTLHPQTIAIDPRYASRKSKEYVTAGDQGIVQLSSQVWGLEKGWEGSMETCPNLNRQPTMPLPIITHRVGLAEGRLLCTREGFT